MRGPYEILVLSHLVPWPPTSGVLLRCYNLLREAARYHKVHVYALHQEVLLDRAAVEESVRHLASFCAEVRVFPIESGGSRWRYAALLARNLLVGRSLLGPALLFPCARAGGDRSRLPPPDPASPVRDHRHGPVRGPRLRSAGDPPPSERRVGAPRAGARRRRGTRSCASTSSSRRRSSRSTRRKSVLCRR